MIIMYIHFLSRFGFVVLFDLVTWSDKRVIGTTALQKVRGTEAELVFCIEEFL